MSLCVFACMFVCVYPTFWDNKEMEIIFGNKETFALSLAPLQFAILYCLQLLFLISLK